MKNKKKDHRPRPLHLFEGAGITVIASDPDDAADVAENWGEDAYLEPGDLFNQIPDDSDFWVFFETMPAGYEFPAGSLVEPMNLSPFGPGFKITAPAAAWATLGRQLLSYNEI